MPLSDITIAITSFLRFGYLAECLRQAKEHLPECRIVVADDSGTPPPVPDDAGLISLPWDSGLTKKRNAIVRAATTPYVLLYCDDFATDADARAGVEKLLSVLENPAYPVDVAGGRVDNQSYEGFLEYVKGSHIKETRLVLNGGSDLYNVGLPGCFKVDLTVNYFLARTDVLREVPWDEEIAPIGGEHVQEFLDLKQAGKTVVWVPGANVNTLRLGAGADVQDPRYGGFRRRAYSMGHTIMKKKYSIQRYVGFDGDVS